MLLVNENLDNPGFNFDKLWKLKVPPKVRCFLWMLKLERVPSKDFLRKRGVLIGEDQCGCSWCGCGCCRRLKLLGLSLSGQLFWSIWLARNDQVFKDVSPKLDEVVFLTKSRALFWLNNSKGGWSPCLEDWWDNPRRFLSKEVDCCKDKDVYQFRP
ncbi:hypothetical protein GQ457_05G033930 [Hibiscus cannabinus]